ncbi:cupin domain-containing protein [Leucobacter sp. HY1908]
MTQIPTIGAHDTAAQDLGPHAPKPTATTAGLTEAGTSVWQAGNIDTGLWECTTGSFTAHREGYTEICTILSGRVTVEVAGEADIEFGPGDIMVMPSGWEGTWHVTEPLRKHYTTIQD